MPDPLFQTLFDETNTLRWQPVEVVRDRARQRTNRVRLVAVAVAVIVVSVVSGGMATAFMRHDARPAPRPGDSASGSVNASATPPARPSDSPSPKPSETSPPAPAIIDAMFLQPDDVGSGYSVVVSEHSGDWTFEFSMSVLQCPSSEAVPSPLTRRYRGLSRGTPPPEDGLSQYVARYQGGAAEAYLNQVRARVAACHPQGSMSVRIGAQRFAGDDALLIEVDFGGGFTTKNVLVRQGGLVTEFFTKPERDSQAVQDLGRKAALRLCEGTPAC
jgi:hypothetical protein